MFKNEGDRPSQILQTFLARLALAVRSRHFGAVPDVPGAVLLDDGRELVAHATLYRPAVTAIIAEAIGSRQGVRDIEVEIKPLGAPPSSPRSVR